MSETATAEAEYYSHTLTHRPLVPVSRYEPHPQLFLITLQLLTLPSEIRARIYHFAFRGNRVAVTSKTGCYCATTTKGPYSDDHHWMLSLPGGGKLRQEVQKAFAREAFWEIHCENAFGEFTRTLRALSPGYLGQVRHLKINIFDTSVDSWNVDLSVFAPGLKDVTFGLWQVGWTIDVPAKEGEPGMSDGAITQKVTHVVDTKAGYGYLRDCLRMGRASRGGWKCYFLFPIRYQVDNFGKVRWQLKVSS